jgi:hypothetical protein
VAPVLHFDKHPLRKTVDVSTSYAFCATTFLFLPLTYNLTLSLCSVSDRAITACVASP